MTETLRSIIPSWRRSLLADGIKPTTISTFRLAAEQLHDYCEREGLATEVTDVNVDAVRGFIVEMRALQRLGPKSAAKAWKR